METIPYRGGFYTGELLAGVPHGNGIWTNPLFNYQGEFSCGLRHGKGKLTWIHDGNTFQGFMKNDTFFHGKYSNGSMWKSGVFWDVDVEKTVVQSVVQPVVQPVKESPAKPVIKPVARRKGKKTSIIKMIKKKTRKQSSPSRSPSI